MTDKNGSNDIAEMLRLLRESVDNDRAKSDNDNLDEKEPEEIIEAEEISEDDDSDPWYDEEEEKAEIEIASEEEREDEEDDEVDPWFSGAEDEPSAETTEEVEEESDEPISEEENVEYIEEAAEEDEPSEEEEIDVFAYPEDDAPVEEDEIDVFASPEEDEELEEIADVVEENEETEEIEEEIFSDIDDDENIDRELEEIQEIEEDNTGDEILDETDISLLQNMGYTSFAMNDTSVDHEEVKHPDNSSKGDIAYDHNGEEHVVRKQADKIKIDYADQKKKTLVRLAVAGVAALLLLVYEYLAFAGIELPGLFNQHEYPVSHAMISLQLLLIAAIMSFDLVVKGIYDAFRFGCTPYSVGSVLILVNAVYTVIVAIFRPENYMLFNFGGALAAVLSILYEYIMLISEEKAFYAVSFSGAKKYAFAEDSDGKHFGNQPTLRAYNTDFNKNFFARMGKRISSYNYLGILIPVSVVLGALICAVLWAVNGDVTAAISAGMLVINFSLPLGVMGAYSIPMLLAMLSLKKEKGAIIGHSATEYYDNTRFVTFDETDLFPSMKTTYIDIKPCGDQPISDVLLKTSMLFSAIGGPLRRMVESSEGNEMGGKVEIVGVFDDGITAKVGADSFHVGSERFLEINKVDVNVPTDYKDADGSNEILYVAIDGKLAARYYIKYVPDPEFVEAVNALGEKGISVGIRTRNPGVNSRIIEKRCPEMKYKVYTIKSVSDDEKDLTSHQSSTDSGIVAHGKASRLVRPLVMALGMKKYYKIDTYLRYASAAIGTLLVVIFAIMGRVGELGSLMAAVYQIVWFVPGIIAALVISSKKKKQ